MADARPRLDAAATLCLLGSALLFLLAAVVHGVLAVTAAFCAGIALAAIAYYCEDVVQRRRGRARAHRTLLPSSGFATWPRLRVRPPEGKDALT